MAKQSLTQLFTSTQLSYFNGMENHTSFKLYHQTKALFPDKQHIYVEDCSFPLEDFLATRDYPRTVLEGESGGFKKLVKVQKTYISLSVENVLQDGIISFDYENTSFTVFVSSWKYPSMYGGDDTQACHFVFDGDDDSAGKALVKHVYEWQNTLNEQIWVFTDGRWSKDKAIYKAIQSANWDDIVLEDELVEQLKMDTETFFESEDVYSSLKITWKRGILLLGPPGNGKTQTIQSLLKDCLSAGIACLYVKAFKTKEGGEYGIRRIFERARQQAPCILVLEDLDAMVTDKLRSFFLNELDGLEQNHEILTIASSNHPEKIDDAIMRRPSRFDQKYTFELPTPKLREEYALKWLAKINPEGSFKFGGKDGEAALAKQIAEKTDDWSFAFMKELFVSFLLRSARERSKKWKSKDKKVMADVEVMVEQVEVLALQVSRGGAAIGKAEVSGDVDDAAKDSNDD